MMEPTREGLQALTEANVMKLQPSLIRPMSPMSISSGEDEVVADLARPERIARLKSWVYNAMQTLVGLGSEGRGVVEADELYVAGPGDVRLRGAGERAAGRGRTRPDDGRDADTDESADVVQPDVGDPVYWETKLRYFEAKCQPLCQERRTRRRLGPAEEQEKKAAAEDAAGVRAERLRIDESRLLWRDKQDGIDAWILGLPPIEPPRQFSPIPDDSPSSPLSRSSPSPAREDDCDSSHNNDNKPSSSDSSIMEITSTQFSHAVGGRQRAPEFTTAVAEIATQERPVDSGNTALPKKEDGGYRGVTHLTSPPESQGAINTFGVLGKRRRLEVADGREDGRWQVAQVAQWGR